MKQKELQEILSDHKKWLGEDGGKRAILRGVDLQGTDLQGANLRNADLWGAILRDADLRNALFRNADLRNADLRGTKLPNFQICPESGSFIAWKKGRNNCIIKLYIPASAKRSSCLKSRKCRAEFVKVLNIFNAKGKSINKCLCWNVNYYTVYKKGQTIYPDKYDPDIRVECTSGIHFFITKKEAKEFSC